MSRTLLARAVEKQNTIWQRMQEITSAAESEDRDLTDEERTNFDAAENDIQTVSRDIERLERMANLDSIDRRQVVHTTTDPEGRDGTEENERRYGEAFERYMRHGMERLTGEQRQLLQDHFSSVRAQGTTPDTAGGYLVPEGFRNTMTETMKAYGGLLSIANVFSTSTGNKLPWPTNDDTGNEGALLSENAQVGELDMLLGQNELDAYTYTSRLVRVSLQLLQDSAFSLDTWLPRKLGERIGRAVAGHLATGTGVDQPQGLSNVATGVTGAAGQITSVTYDDLIELEHSVDPAYRGNAQYGMHDQSLKVIRKLKDADGRPLWSPVPAPGFPSTINGYRYTVDNKLPIPAASAKSIFFGDFKAGLLVRQVLGVQVMRLTERYADYLQVGFLGFARFDSVIDDAAAVRAYAHPAT